MTAPELLRSESQLGAPPPAEALDEVDQLRYRVDGIASDEVLREVLAQTQRQLDAEERRFAVLNQKAQLLLGQAGAAVTLAGSIAGGALLANSARIPQWVANSMSVALAIVVVLGALTTIRAGLVLRVTASAEISKLNVVSAAGTQSLDVYRRFMIVHLWEVHAGLRSRLDRMADGLSGAQRLFVVFLIAAGLIGATLAFLPMLIHGGVLSDQAK